MISIVLEPTLSDTDENGTNDGEEDTDGDGLTNLEEIALGSSITRSDTDGDGLSDGDEIRLYLTDPLLAFWLTQAKMKMCNVLLL